MDVINNDRLIKLSVTIQLTFSELRTKHYRVTLIDWKTKGRVSDTLTSVLPSKILSAGSPAAIACKLSSIALDTYTCKTLEYCVMHGVLSGILDLEVVVHVN